MKIRESSRKILHILLAVVLIINLSIVGAVFMLNLNLKQRYVKYLMF